MTLTTMPTKSLPADHINIYTYIRITGNHLYQIYQPIAAGPIAAYPSAGVFLTTFAPPTASIL